MADGHIFVAKVAMREPEEFLFVTLAGDYSRIVQTSGSMTEEELRTKLRSAGMPDTEIASYIEHARKHPA